MEKYYLYQGITKKGPYSLNELKKHKIYAESKIWKEGLEDWTPASEFQELQKIIQLKPPSRIKPLSYFIKDSSELKLKATLIITFCVYLFTALVLIGGLETLIFKFNNEELLVDPTPAEKEVILRRKDSSETLRIIDVNKYREYIPNVDIDDPNLNVLLKEKLNSIIGNAFFGPVTILITIVTFAISMISNNFKYEDFRTYLNQYRDILK